MKVTILPKNTLSRWSFWFLMASGVFFIVFFAIIAIFDPEGGDTFFSNPSLFIPILLAFIASFLAFASGIYSIIFHSGRSVSVFLTTLIGLLITIFGLSATLFSV